MDRHAAALTSLSHLSPKYVAKLRARFFAKVTPEPTTGCHLWTGAVNSQGYGNIGVDGSVVCAHRVAWLLERGDLPAGVVTDHGCRNRACVNPAHLEPVTNAENIRRGLKGVLHVQCLRGHDLSVPGALTNTQRPRCRACRSIHNAKYSSTTRRAA